MIEQRSIESMQSLRVVLDQLPPSLNNAYPTGRNGRRYAAPALVAFKDYAIPLIRLEAAARRFEPPPGMPWTVHAILTFPKPWKSDLDGRAKALVDACAAAIGLDDRYVVSLLLEKQLGPQERVELYLATAPHQRVALPKRRKGV
jgi:Holliday junction resolvase RusA-like endonuclease